MDRATISLILLILIGLGILTFVFILYIIIKNLCFKSMRDDLIKIYNKLILENFEKKNIPIEHIGYRNQKYEPIAELFQEYSMQYATILENIKSNIYNLSKYIKNYDWINFKKIYKQTYNDLNNLNTSINNINKYYDDILQYRNYISYIIVSYCEKSKSIINFYEKNVGPTYDNENIKNVIDKIKNHCIQLEQFVNKIDLLKIMDTLKEFNNNYKNAFSLISNLYIRNKEQKYINYNIAEIEEVLKTDFNKITKENEKKAHKLLMVIKNSEKTLNKKINNNDFEHVEIIIKDIIEKILFIKKSFNLNFTSNEFLNKNINSVIDSFESVINESTKLYGFLNKINQNFNSIPLITESVSGLKNKLNALTKKCNLFIRENSTKKNNSTSFFLNSKDIVMDIIKWCDEFSSLINEVVNKYVYFKKIITEISSLKLLLAQMMAFLKKSLENNDKINKKFCDEINNLSIELNKMEKKFNDEYEITFQYKYNELLDIKHNIYEICKNISIIYFKKTYVKKLIYYANILMINENTNIDLKEADDYYNARKYDESLNIILKQLKPYKLKSDLINIFND